MPFAAGSGQGPRGLRETRALFTLYVLLVPVASVATF